MNCVHWVLKGDYLVHTVVAQWPRITFTVDGDLVDTLMNGWYWGRWLVSFTITRDTRERFRKLEAR